MTPAIDLEERNALAWQARVSGAGTVLVRPI